MHLLKALPRFRQAQQALAQFEQREAWTAGDVRDFQLARLNQVWAHARKSVPHYRDLAVQFLLPEQFCSLSEFIETVPVLSKEDVRDQPKRFLSEAPQPGRWHRTGGSTGTPMSVYWSHQAHREMLRSKYRCEQAHGLDVFDRKVFLWGHSGSFAPGLKGFAQRISRPIQDRLRNRLRVSAYHLGHHDLRKHLRAIERFNPLSLYGYSSAIELLARAAAEDSVVLPSLKVAILTAEPADCGMLKRVATDLGTRAVIEYGSVECGLIGYLMPDKTIRSRDDVCFVETLPSKSIPDSYDYVVTVLNNPSFPLLRYRIEDSTSRCRQQPDVGFGILADVRGRSNDVLLSKSGHVIHSLAVKHILEHSRDIRRFRAMQRGDGGLTVLIESEQALSASLLVTFQSRLQQLLEGFPVEIQVVDRIPSNLAGKHRWITSEMRKSQLGNARCQSP
ncbi:MAG: hypothetical protein AAGA03_03690 [Planctomycetota bacterium]